MRGMANFSVRTLSAGFLDRLRGQLLASTSMLLITAWTCSCRSVVVPLTPTLVGGTYGDITESRNLGIQKERA
jgi:hypothetical protein